MNAPEPAPPFDRILALLRGDQSPRVWSLLVTVFGELAQQQDARISGALVNRITGLIGIKPEATRVALHRLRKDGWIDSERIGRNSAYGLTEWGRAQSAQASPIIYMTDPPATRAFMVISDQGEASTARTDNGIWVASNIQITSAAPTAERAFVVQIDQPLPDWIKDRLCPPQLTWQSDALSQRLAHALSSLQSSPQLSQTQTAALRVLIVHGWRRVALKAPALPDAILPDQWRGADCRKQVGELLLHLPKATLEELEAGVSA